jgi:SAM-dependent methyltransferase
MFTLFLILLLLVVLAAVAYLAYDAYLLIIKKSAPFVPSDKKIFQALLAQYDQEKPLLLLELGSGLGSGLRYMAKRTNWSFIGYELAPVPFYISRILNKLFGLSKRIKIYRKDFFTADLSQADLIYVYLFQRLNERLTPEIIRQAKPEIEVVSYAFAFPGLVIAKEIEAPKTLHKILRIYKKP